MNHFYPRIFLLVALGLAGCVSIDVSDTAARRDLASKVVSPSTGATAVRVTALEDGGLMVNGSLSGKTFSLAFPVDWDGANALLFAHGYTAPGSATDVPEDLLEEDPSAGLLKYAYLQGYAVGAASYSKAGLGVQSGAEATFKLREYLERIGTRKVYVSGASMGGNIVVTLLEQHPDAFAGGLAVCGATNDFGEVIGRLIDLRAVYDYYTVGTAYELPGSHDLNVSAVMQELPWGLAWAQKPWGLLQAKRIYDPVMALFAAAKANPEGREAEIISKISAITGWDADPGAFALPILTITKGMDDVRATSGGSPYANSDKLYSAPGMSKAEIAALNAGIARIKSDPAAVAYMAKWHAASGQFHSPLVTLHNSVDSLVPYSQSTEFGARTALAGNQDRLAQLTVPPMRRAMPMTELDGFMHCGFRPEQTSAAWDELRRWVELGEKPANGTRK